MSKTRPILLRAIFIVFVAAIPAGWISWKYHPQAILPPRFAVVEPAAIFRSGQPSPAQLRHLIDNYGLRTLLIVREDTGDNVKHEIDFARNHGLNVVVIPVASRRPIPEAQVEEFFRCTDDRRNHPLLIHCSAGRHRTGYLCARYRIDRQGWQPQRAVEELLSFGFDAKDQSVVLDQIKNYRPGGTATSVSRASSGAGVVP